MFNLFNNSYSNNRQTSNIVTSNAVDSFETLQKTRRDLIGEIQAVIEYDDHTHSTTDTLARETW